MEASGSPLASSIARGPAWGGVRAAAVGSPWRVDTQERPRSLGAFEIPPQRLGRQVRRRARVALRPASPAGCPVPGASARPLGTCPTSLSAPAACGEKSAVNFLYARA